MSAERLREAARLMHERAQAATPGPWRSADQVHGEWFGIQSEHLALGTAFDAPNADHIASWHPVVALAVADWLDQHAETHDYMMTSTHRRSPCPHPNGQCEAIAVADAYLGGAE